MDISSVTNVLVPARGVLVLSIEVEMSGLSVRVLCEAVTSTTVVSVGTLEIEDSVVAVTLTVSPNEKNWLESDKSSDDADFDS